jgi:hypothetical protein
MLYLEHDRLKLNRWGIPARLHIWFKVRAGVEASPVVAIRVEDYYPKGKRWWVRLHEKRRQTV